jgi:hypothetical protein
MSKYLYLLRYKLHHVLLGGRLPLLVLLRKEKRSSLPSHLLRDHN